MPIIEQSIEIDAPVEHIYAIARDVERFPEFMRDLLSLKVLERNADNTRTISEWRGIVREFKLTIKWTQEDVWDDAAHTDEFVQIKGDMDRLAGRWAFTPLSESRTRFDSLLDYDYNVPLIGSMVKNLIKKKLADNLQATMEGIKQRAEQSLPRN